MKVVSWKKETAKHRRGFGKPDCWRVSEIKWSTYTGLKGSQHAWQMGKTESEWVCVWESNRKRQREDPVGRKSKETQNRIWLLSPMSGNILTDTWKGRVPGRGGLQTEDVQCWLLLTSKRRMLWTAGKQITSGLTPPLQLYSGLSTELGDRLGWLATACTWQHLLQQWNAKNYMPIKNNCLQGWAVGANFGPPSPQNTKRPKKLNPPASEEPEQKQGVGAKAGYLHMAPCTDHRLRGTNQRSQPQPDPGRTFTL